MTGASKCGFYKQSEYMSWITVRRNGKLTSLALKRPPFTYLLTPKVVSVAHSVDKKGAADSWRDKWPFQSQPVRAVSLALTWFHIHCHVAFNLDVR